MFDVGQRVVCVEDRFPHAVRNYLRDLPRKNGIYTVRDVIPAQEWGGGHTCAILLGEIHNPPAPHRKEWGECGFDPRRFRPVEEIEQESESFEGESVTGEGCTGGALCFALQKN
jgi:hypothetical protein